MKKPGIAIVLGMGKPRPGAEKGLGKEMAKDDEEAEDMAYSDEQKAMAEELSDAVKASDAEGILKAIHGIYESYKVMESGEGY